MNKRASISAGLRADASGWKKGCDTARAEIANLKQVADKTKINIASDVNMAAKVKEFRGEVLKAGDAVSKLAAQYRTAAMTATFGGPIGMKATGLKLKGDGAAPFSDGGFADKTNVSIRELTRNTLTANTALMGTKKGATNAGMGLLMLSQGIDDAQYGFRSIVNNIAPLAMALGAGTGLAGTLTIAAVGFNLMGESASKAWAKMTGEDEMQKARKNSERMEEMHANRLKRLEQEAAMSGEFQAKLANDVEDSNDRFRANHAEEIKAKQETLDLEMKIKQARISSLDPIKKAADVAQIEQKANSDKLALEAQMYQERLNNGKGKAEEAQKLAAKLTAEKQKLDLEPYLGPKGKTRQAELPGLIDNANTTAAAETRRMREDTAALKDVKNRQANLSKEKELAEAENLTAKKDKAVKDAIEVEIDAMKKKEARIKALDAEEERAAVKAMQNAKTKASMDNAAGSRMARHMGKNRKADKMDDANKIDQLVKEGLPRSTAEDLVNRDRSQAEDEALGPRRRKLRNLPKGVTSRVEIPGPVMPLPIRPGKGKGVDPDPVEKKGMESEAAIKVLSRIEENTRKTAAEQQQPAKRS